MTNRIEETYKGYKLIAQKDENGIVYTSASRDNNVSFWFRDNTGQDFKTTEQAMSVAKKMVDEIAGQTNSFTMKQLTNEL